MQDLRERIAARAAVVGIIGQGYVGLPLALVFHEARFRVLGFDIDPKQVAAFSPEREDPGRKDFSTRNTPKLVGGVNPRSTEAAAALYGACLESVVPVSHARVAESAKLLENIFRSVNIALVNELKMILDRMGIDVWEVIRAAATKPFGFMPLDRKSTRLNSSHLVISYAVFC